MKTASTQLFHTLKTAGHRLTRARKEIVQTLCSAEEPLTVQMIVERVAVDEASVYRTVALLLELRLIEEIVEQGKVRRYALAHGHHHHIVCRSCGYVEHIPCTDVRPIRVRHLRFKTIESHDVTYYGRCKDCV